MFCLGLNVRTARVDATSGSYETKVTIHNGDELRNEVNTITADFANDVEIYISSVESTVLTSYEARKFISALTSIWDGLDVETVINDIDFMIEHDIGTENVTSLTLNSGAIMPLDFLGDIMDQIIWDTGVDSFEEMYRIVDDCLVFDSSYDYDMVAVEYCSYRGYDYDSFFDSYINWSAITDDLISEGTIMEFSGGYLVRT